MSPGEPIKNKRFTFWSVLAGVVLLGGGIVVVLRFLHGLAYATNLTHTTTWGLWTGFKLVFVALAASGYVMTTGVYILGQHRYHALVRPAVLSGFMGYSLFILILLFDLGRAWRIYVPFLVQAGVTSALFEIALCVALYYTTQFLELTPVGFEWLGWKRWRRAMVGATVALTVFGLMLSFLHQSTLGALFLTVPGKLHPLWYSPYIPFLFFLSSAVGGFCMTILLANVCKRIYRERMEVGEKELERLTLGLGKGASIALAIYFATKLADLALNNNWGYLSSGWGMWYLVEVVGFVLLPCVLFLSGYRSGRTRPVIGAAAWAVAGIVLNRLNVAVVAFNWKFPLEQRYLPSWMEWVAVAFLITLGITIYKFVVEHFYILREHPDYRAHPAEPSRQA